MIKTMNDRATLRPMTVSIAAVERDTGLSKDALRVWERRYGFPVPVRDAWGERAYPMEQVEKLRVIRRLLDAGHRPGRIVTMTVEELQSMGESLIAEPHYISQTDKTELREYLAMIKSHDVDGLRRMLGQALMRMGVSSLICDVVAPLNTAVGDAWIRGQIEVFEEHMYTESVNIVLRSAIAASPISLPEAAPRVLLTTVPQEPHGVGLLMVEAMLALEGCRCVSLGTQTPIRDIVLAVSAHRADIVALSFTASPNPNDVVNGLEELRSLLSPQTALWAGGACPIIHRRSLEGVTTIASLQDIGSQVEIWRNSR